VLKRRARNGISRVFGVMVVAVAIAVAATGIGNALSGGEAHAQTRGVWLSAPPSTPNAIETCPQERQWLLLYWGVADSVSISNAAEECFNADVFWISRGGRWLAYSKSAPNASDDWNVVRGEAHFIRGGQPTGTLNRVDVYLIKMGGGQVGCGDSAVALSRSIAPTQAPLGAALRELLSIKDREVGPERLYNALYQSDLQVDRLELQNGKATIRLTGELRLGGVCDSPRVEAQLVQTAWQFSTVSSVEVFINGRPLSEVLSGR
jgi:hypothetical protein